MLMKRNSVCSKVTVVQMFLGNIYANGMNKHVENNKHRAHFKEQRPTNLSGFLLRILANRVRSECRCVAVKPVRAAREIAVRLDDADLRRVDAHLNEQLVLLALNFFILDTLH